MFYLWDKNFTHDINKYIQHNNQIIIQYSIKPLKEDEEFVKMCQKGWSWKFCVYIKYNWLYILTFIKDVTNVLYKLLILSYQVHQFV